MCIRDSFTFLPRWRIDDIMISFAATGGSVGAHVDQYDVFLLQGMGHRRWQIDARPNPPAAIRDDVELKMLREFTPSHDWVLGPGDMLYLPPRWAHDGIAVGDDCMTYSAGFRVPQRGGLAGGLALRMADEFEDTTLYRDPGQDATAHPAGIPAGLQDFAADALQRLSLIHILDESTVNDMLDKMQDLQGEEPAKPDTAPAS